MVSSRQMIRCSPDTVEYFENFSMSSVIAELQASCPEVYCLVRRLGSTQRNVRDARRSVEGCHGNMHSPQCTVCEGKGSATNFDAGCKGNRQIGIYTSCSLSNKINVCTSIQVQMLSSRP